MLTARQPPPHPSLYCKRSALFLASRTSQFFWLAVMWPQASAASPFAGSFEAFNALVSIVAFVAVWEYQRGIMAVIAAGAAVGLLATYLS